MPVESQPSRHWTDGLLVGKGDQAVSDVAAGVAPPSFTVFGTPSSGQVPVWNATTGRWEPDDAGGGAAIELAPHSTELDDYTLDLMWWSATNPTDVTVSSTAPVQLPIIANVNQIQTANGADDIFALSEDNLSLKVTRPGLFWVEVTVNWDGSNTSGTTREVIIPIGVLGSQHEVRSVTVPPQVRWTGTVPSHYAADLLGISFQAFDADTFPITVTSTQVNAYPVMFFG